MGDLNRHSKDIANRNIQQAREYKVSKSNEIIRYTRNNLTVIQSKIISFLISRIKPDDKEFKSVQFSITDFCKICEMPVNGSYSHVKDSLKSLRDKSIWVTKYDKDGNPIEVTFSWISKVAVSPATDAVEITISDDLKPYLLQLKANFTSYPLADVVKFKSRYTAWFYDNIASLKNIGYWIVSVDEIKEAFNLNMQYKYLRPKVIEKALTEINDYTDYNLSYDVIKKGRSVDKLKIYIEKKENTIPITVEAV